VRAELALERVVIGGITWQPFAIGVLDPRQPAIEDDPERHIGPCSVTRSFDVTNGGRRERHSDPNRLRDRPFRKRAHWQAVDGVSLHAWPYLLGRVRGIFGKQADPQIEQSQRTVRGLRVQLD
jgi:hypothetical protein